MRRFFLKDRRTYETKGAFTIYSYTLARSIYTILSTVVGDYLPEIESGDIVFDKDFMGIVDTFERIGDTSMQVKIKAIEYLFSRDMVYLNDGWTYPAEIRIEKYITEQFKEQPDNLYRTPYVNVTRLSSSDPMPPDIFEGTWNIKSYISKSRRLQDIYTTFEITNDTFEVTIGKDSIPRKKIFTTNRYVEILEEAIDNDILAKITAFNRSIHPTTVHNYYLLEDGTFTTDMNAPGRARGRWDTLQIMEEETANELIRVKETFQDYGKKSHKISFLMPTEYATYQFYDPVLIEVRKIPFYSNIVTKIDYDNGTTEYRCGELNTTLTDKINVYF